jgi:hypothetical protein
MIHQIVLELKWLPTTIGSLFIDSQDYLGIEYWYDAVYKMLKQVEPKKVI